MLAAATIVTRMSSASTTPACRSGRFRNTPGYAAAVRAADRTAREALGCTLRDEQRQAVDSVAAGRDTLVVMPYGRVQRYEGDKMVVLFDDVGYEALSVELVVEHDLLEPA